MLPSSWSQSAATTALRKVHMIASFSESSDCAKSHTGEFWGAVWAPYWRRRPPPPGPARTHTIKEEGEEIVCVALYYAQY